MRAWLFALFLSALAPATMAIEEPSYEVVQQLDGVPIYLAPLVGMQGLYRPKQHARRVVPQRRTYRSAIHTAIDVRRTA